MPSAHKNKKQDTPNEAKKKLQGQASMVKQTTEMTDIKPDAFHFIPLKTGGLNRMAQRQAGLSWIFSFQDTGITTESYLTCLPSEIRM